VMDGLLLQLLVLQSDPLHPNQDHISIDGPSDEGLLDGNRWQLFLTSRKLIDSI
jgi:hypothetical protein